jgi:Kef-type K+ transport system membrane component KefB
VWKISENTSSFFFGDGLRLPHAVVHILSRVYYFDFSGAVFFRSPGLSTDLQFFYEGYKIVFFITVLAAPRLWSLS